MLWLYWPVALLAFVVAVTALGFWAPLSDVRDEAGILFFIGSLLAAACWPLALLFLVVRFLVWGPIVKVRARREAEKEAGDRAAWLRRIQEHPGDPNAHRGDG